jgi:FAD:protein FMN transferase
VTPRRAWVQTIMGMPTSVHVRGPHATAPEIDAEVRELFDRLHDADATFSTYRPDSAVSRYARGETAAVPDRLVEVIELCEQARSRTGGLFDAMLPDAAGTRRFDPSGLVKGWAVERAADAFVLPRGHGLLVNAGGDVVVRYCGPGGEPWRVGIEDPADRSTILAVVPLSSGAVATSGTAARGEHLVDPRTGTPATALRSVTVTGPSLMWADVHATAAFVAGGGAIPYLRGLHGYAGVVVAADGTVESCGFATAKPVPMAR